MTDVTCEIENGAVRWHTLFEGGGATPAQVSEFEEWLSADARHAKAYAELVELSDTIGELRDLSVLSGRESSTGPFHRETSSRTTIRWIFAVATAATLCLCVFGLIRWIQPDTYSTKIGESRSLALSDGSRVSLGGDTTVRVSMRRNLRLIELKKGEAFFEVHKDSTRPFLVRSRGTDIYAVGTKFNVVDRVSGVTVAVAEGQVVVRRSAQIDTNVPRVDRVSKGQQLQVLVSGRTEQSRVPDIDKVASWRTNHLVFVDQPLQDVVSDLNRYLPEPLILSDDELRDLKVTAVIDAGDPQTILTAIEASLRVRELRTTDGIVLLR